MISSANSVQLTPPHLWREVPFWSLFRRVKEINHPDEELLSVYRDHGVVPTASRDDNFNKPSLDLSGYQLVRKGALVTNKMKAWQGSIAISRHRGIVSPAYYVYEPLSREHDQYLHYLLRSQPFVALYQRISKGVRVNQWDLEHEALRIVPIRLPDLPTQKAIANFLDRETVRIDQLIEKKQRMVEVLGERLCAERESSVWVNTKLAKLGHHINIISGYAFPSDGFSHDPDDFRLLRGANVGVDSLRWDDVVYWPADDTEQLKRFRLQIGDLVMGMDRPWISGGMRVATVGPGDVPSFLLQRVCKIKPRATMNHAFLKELLHSRRFLAYFEPILTGVSVPHISSDQIANFRFPYVAPDVQASKMEHFKKLADGVRMAINTTNISIGRLREFRSALITAAVTGQIDVSTWSNQGTSDRRLDQIEEATSA